MSQITQTEQITEAAHQASRTLVSELGVKHGEITIRVVEGRPKGIRRTHNWEEGKSEISCGRRNISP